jgi:hypothetical protein
MSTFIHNMLGLGLVALLWVATVALAAFLYLEIKKLYFKDEE